MYKFISDGVHAEVLDFPGVMSCAGTLEDARRMLQGALVDMAETALLTGVALPIPDPSRSDPSSGLEEPIHLIIQAATRITLLSEEGVL